MASDTKALLFPLQRTVRHCKGPDVTQRLRSMEQTRHTRNLKCEGPSRKGVSFRWVTWRACAQPCEGLDVALRTVRVKPRRNGRTSGLCHSKVSESGATEGL